uniref:Uncharacterized protein n=1 Tax=Ascaris lumbricoides TaxID=6252 RepID=A0A0M3HYH4_ASCLU
MMVPFQKCSVTRPQQAVYCTMTGSFLKYSIVKRQMRIFRVCL